jgi:FkbM family methyltransferase
MMRIIFRGKRPSEEAGARFDNVAEQGTARGDKASSTLSKKSVMYATFLMAMAALSLPHQSPPSPSSSVARVDSRPQSLHAAINTPVGDGWSMFSHQDFQKTTPNPHGFTCTYTPFKSSTGIEKDPDGATIEICVHPSNDGISENVKKAGRFSHCDDLSQEWNERISSKVSASSSGEEEPIYVEIGANIGTCILEMLVGTNAPIIAFEPNPMNYYAVRETMRKLHSSYQKRLLLFPVALGSEQGTNKIFTAEGNAGNSIVGKIIKDSPKQQFDEMKQFDIYVERLDHILKPGPRIPLVKMDAQGYECEILKGMGADVAHTIERVHFENAKKWLRAQNCLDLTQRFEEYGFRVTPQGGFNAIASK